MTEHWATRYIGLPWRFGAEGPEEFDCWGFVRWIEREHFDRELPSIDVPNSWREAHDLIATHEEREKWDRVDEPAEGDVVLMARNGRPMHVGVCVFANGRLGVLHCAQPSGVVFQLKDQLKVSGWGHLTYYRRGV